MGGFIKGMAVGLASFVLGFAVLSVVLPTPDAVVPGAAVGDPDLINAEVMSVPGSAIAQGAAGDAVPAPAVVPALVPALAPVGNAGAAPTTGGDGAASRPSMGLPPAAAQSATPVGDGAPEDAASQPVLPGSVIDPATGTPMAPMGQLAVEVVPIAPSAVPTPAMPVPAEPTQAEPTPTAPALAPMQPVTPAETDRGAPAATPAPAVMPTGGQGGASPAISAETLTPTPVADPMPTPTPTPTPTQTPNPTPTPTPTPTQGPAEALTPAPARPAAPAAVPPAPPDTATPDTATPDRPTPDTATPGVESPTPTPIPEPTPTVPRRLLRPDPNSVPAPNAPHAPRAPGVPRIPASLVAPVPARLLPIGEPTLPMSSPETAGPRVSTLPSGIDGVAVRRGTAEEAAPLAAVPGVTTGRLPRIGVTPAAPPRAPGATGAEPAQPLVRRFAANIALAEGEHGVGVVLSDDPGAEAALLALPFAVTVAVPPDDPDAPRRAAAYRAAGHEIAILAQGLPPLATPSDIAVTLNAWERAFPQAMAVMDVAVNGLGASPELARGLATMLAPEGWGVIARRDGVDALLQAARAERLAAVPVYRQLGAGAGAAPTEAAQRRLIDRAAFEAQRQSGVLIAGSAADAATMAALTAYAQNGRPGVLLVPASAVMQGR